MLQEMLAASGGGGGSSFGYFMVWDNTAYDAPLYCNGELVKTFENNSTLQTYDDDNLTINFQGYSHVTVTTKKSGYRIRNYSNAVVAITAGQTVYNNVNFMSDSPWGFAYSS